MGDKGVARRVGKLTTAFVGGCRNIGVVCRV